MQCGSLNGDKVRCVRDGCCPRSRSENTSHRFKKKNRKDVLGKQI